MLTHAPARKHFTAKRRRADQKERRCQGKRARLLRHEPLEDRRLLAVAPLSAFVFGLSETGGASGDDIAVDEQGNTYVTGSFGGTDVDFGPGNLLSSSEDSEDIFVAKHDPGGNLAWVQTIGGNSQDRPNGIDVDSAGNVYLTGNVSGNVLFGNEPYSTPSGHRGHFVTKLSSDGDFLWTTQMWDSQDRNTTGMDVVIDETDGVRTLYTTGSKATSKEARYAATIAQLDPAHGGVNWSQLITTSVNSTSRGYSLDTDNDGNVFLGGVFSGQIDVGGTSLKAIKSGRSPGADIFLTRLDPEDGSFQWAKRMGGPEADIMYGIDVHSNSVVASGFFNATADFGSVTLTSHGEKDVFLMKADTDTGNVLWAKGFGGADTDHANDVAIDSTGNIFVTGDFRGVADFDPGGGAELQEVGQYGDAFVSQFNADGSFANVWQIGGTPTDIGEGIVADSAGNVYATGRASRGAEFPTGLVTPEYGVTAYVMRLGEADPNNTPPTAVDDSAPTNEDTAVDIAVLTNDYDQEDTIQIASFTQGANGLVENKGDGTLRYTPVPNFNGTDSFTYTISDGQGGTDRGTVTVTVTAVADPPQADAGGPYTVSEGGTVQLDASGSTDPDLPDDVLSYSWTSDSGGAFDNPTISAPVFDATGLIPNKVVTITVEVTDSKGNVDSDTSTVTVQEIPLSREYSSSGGAMTIRDKKTVSSPISISGTGLSVAALTVRINLTHANAADLTAQLVSPTGLTLDLSGPIVSGDYEHTYDFSGMADEPVDGTWTLKVTDNTRDKKQGELIEWKMKVVPKATSAFATDMALTSWLDPSEDDESELLAADDLVLLLIE